jgi:hypothetical protein
MNRAAAANIQPTPLGALVIERFGIRKEHLRLSPISYHFIV